jgi:hypothetical protein
MGVKKPVAFPESPFRELCEVVEIEGWTVTRDCLGIESLGPPPPIETGGVTLYALRRIVIPSAILPVMVGQPLIHELAHALMHGNSERTSEELTMRELEARTVAFAVASVLDLVIPGQDLGSVLPKPYSEGVTEAMQRLLAPSHRSVDAPFHPVGFYWETGQGAANEIHAVRPMGVRETVCGQSSAELVPPHSRRLQWCVACGSIAAGTESMPL